MARQTKRGARDRGLEARVRLLTRGLGLDADQQVKLRRTLTSEREQLLKARTDPSIPADQRTGAVVAILDKAGDEIRSFLNDDQRRKYQAARQVRDSRPDRPGQAEVEYWMRLQRGQPKRTAQAPTTADQGGAR